jgi:protein SCO1/2
MKPSLWLLLALTCLGGGYAPTSAQGGYRGGVVTPPLSKPNFVLTDTSGASFDFRRSTQGYVTLLFSGTPARTNIHTWAHSEALPAGVGDQVKLIFVTTDPARDTPAVLRRWLDLFDRRFIGLTGTESAIESVQRAAGVPLAKKAPSDSANYAVAHANFVLAYTKDNLAHVIYPGGVSKQDWVHDLPLLVNATWPSR